MNIAIKYPASKILQDLGLYYIFSSQEAGGHYQYQSLPATNLCLTIYKANTVQTRVSRSENTCIIHPGSKVHSRLYGFHKKQLDVTVHGEMDQVCVIFQAGGLRLFTRVPYGELMPETDVLGLLFGQQGASLAERLFATEQTAARVAVLDAFLSKALQENRRQLNIDRLVSQLDRQPANSRVVSLAATENKDTSTLYRHFKQYVGQSPKEYLKVIRFRRALKALLHRRYLSLTELAYDLGYYDQSHFIKDFTQITDCNPGLIHQVTTVVQEELVLIPRS
ncbi:helix-turn-helix domain-containing protein [Paraflavitalea pollutisoli]|uniref:helix-turn-helix domain-containing protein n=1 Tax=Paraflavitalea pollutisoli TaxID=3034143 RepID=UPI0023ECE5C9|nr:helix-turn-helix domain-containing protein [Paraflavitalea sp. H1-2-19X]